jgi:hypothetical protein
MLIDALVEGPLDEAVARRLVTYAGHAFGTCYGKKGAGYIRDKLAGFDMRARYGAPLLTLVDFMDTGLDCPPAVVSAWLPQRAYRHLVRAVVPEIESWLLADRIGVSAFLGISKGLIPRDPEIIPDPKQTLINLARRCRSRKRREALVPCPNASANTGPGYAAEMQKFVANSWDITAASQFAPSLAKCLVRLRELT